MYIKKEEKGKNETKNNWKSWVCYCKIEEIKNIHSELFLYNWFLVLNIQKYLIRLAAAARRGIKSSGLKAGFSSSPTVGLGSGEGVGFLVSGASAIVLAAGRPLFRLFVVGGVGVADVIVGVAVDDAAAFDGVVFAFAFVFFCEVPGAGLGEGEATRFLFAIIVRFGAERVVFAAFLGPSCPSVLEEIAPFSSLKI